MTLEEEKIRLIKAAADIREFQLKQMQGKVRTENEAILKAEIVRLKAELAEQKKLLSIAIEEVTRLEIENKFLLSVKENLQAQL